MPSSDTQFKPGNKGRPKGVRNKISEKFLKAFALDFAKHGAAVIAQVREERPHEYLKLISHIVPKDIQLTGDLPVLVLDWQGQEPG